MDYQIRYLHSEWINKYGTSNPKCTPNTVSLRLLIHQYGICCMRCCSSTRHGYCFLTNLNRQSDFPLVFHAQWLPLNTTIVWEMATMMTFVNLQKPMVPVVIDRKQHTQEDSDSEFARILDAQRKRRQSSGGWRLLADTSMGVAENLGSFCRPRPRHFLRTTLGRNHGGPLEPAPFFFF